MDYLPLFHRLNGQPAVLVGGGEVASRKARMLLDAGAKLTVIAPEIGPELENLHKNNLISHCYKRIYRGPDDLVGCVLVVVATDDEVVNRKVAKDAKALNLPVNVVDNPAVSSCIFPAVVDRSPLVIAVSSGGRSPVLARLLRRRLETMLPGSYGRLAEFLGDVRSKFGKRVRDPGKRRQFFEELAEGPVAELVLSGNSDEAARLVQSRLANPEGSTLGDVALVGAGPGDPDLMTFKAVRLLQSADVVLHDRLVAPAIIDMARRDAERIYVGKQRADHSVPQQEINQLLVDLALAGKRVVRLKGGDPFIFGRGGEEIELLAKHGIPFQVVPGITAASGAACYAGIPLTHRDHAQSVRFVTGHLKDGELRHDWRQFSSEQETLVFYMGLAGLPTICRELQAHGRSPDTPIALIEKATTPQQRLISGTLATMIDIVEREQPRAPTLIIVGGVAGLSGSLGWYEKGD